MAFSLRVGDLRTRRLRVDDFLSINGPIDCRDQPIHNVGLAVSARDAVCKLQLDNLFNQSLNTFNSPTFTDLTVTGTLTAIYEAVEVKDPIISLAVGNPADSNNIGFSWEYLNGTPKWGGLLRNYTTGSVRLFKEASAQPTISTSVSTLAPASLEVDSISANSVLGANNAAVGLYLGDGIDTYLTLDTSTSAEKVRIEKQLYIGSGSNEYNLPLTRGASAQVLQTDDSGNVTWTDGSAYIAPQWGANLTIGGYALVSAPANTVSGTAKDPTTEFTTPVKGNVWAISYNTTSATTSTQFAIWVNGVQKTPITATGTSGFDSSIDYSILPGHKLAIQYTGTGTPPGVSNFSLLIK